MVEEPTSPFPIERIVGVETEFGCLVADDRLGNPAAAAELIKDYVFKDLKLGAIDRYARDDVFEPAGSGGFLMNGARLYVDAVGSHLEYATAECRSLRDLVANDRAGQVQIVRALKELGLDDAIHFYNNSVDHFGGHTFGCHENYLIQARDDLLNEALSLFFPFLVSRQVFAGVGRVGGHLLVSGVAGPSYEEMMENPVDYIWVSNIYGVVADDRVPFQLSQRADHILKTVASRVRFNRALINPKWETLYTHNGMTRLHLLFGEANQNEFAYALKVGTTMLVIRLLEEGRVPDDVLIRQPLVALREISRDQGYRWEVERYAGGTIRAVDLQRLYLAAAQVYRGETAQTDWILDEWEAILDGLENDPMQLGDRVDWVAKRQILEQYIAEEQTDWADDALHSVDLEYHNLNPDLSLFHAWQEMGRTRRMVSKVDIVTATTDPPSDTRAKARGRLVEQVMARKLRRYAFDWGAVQLGDLEYVELPDPFNPYDGVNVEPAA